MTRAFVAVLVVSVSMGACATDLAAPDAGNGSKEDQTPAQVVCTKLTTEALAAQDDRLAYLKKIQPQADGVGLGIGPAVNITIDGLERKNRKRAAEGFAMIERTCGLARE